MYQRLLFTLSILLISVAAMSQDVMTPTDGDYVYNPNAPLGSLTNPIPAAAGIVQKWIHDPSQNPGVLWWDQTKFKSYRLNEMSYRVRFPNNYNPANKYPMVVFFHGAGEPCNFNGIKNTKPVNRENEMQLKWGTLTFSNYIDQGLWNGFILCPQLWFGGAEWDTASNIPLLNAVIDKLIQYNGVDQDRITAVGLSAGGLGTLTYATYFPKRVATVVTSCPELVQNVTPSVSKFLQIPVFMASGGSDPSNADPTSAIKFHDAFARSGGNMYFNYYPTYDHYVWDAQWTRTDVNNNVILTPYFNTAHKAQPLVYFQQTQFCTGAAISAKMGITPNFAAYEWQFDNGSGFTTIPGATSSDYTATAAGQYRVHFKRDAAGPWSDWTPKPVVISTKACSLDTAFVEHFDKWDPTYFTTNGGGNTTSSYTYESPGCQSSIFPNATESISQDALGNMKGGFLLNTTATTCAWHVGDQVWRTYYPNTTPVTKNTDYTFSFYLANQSVDNQNNSTRTPVAQLVPAVRDGVLTGGVASAVSQGNLSWKKFSYNWNSGDNTEAWFELRNNTATALGVEGNDFAIDEITLVKSKPVPMPGNAFRNVTLWSKASNILDSAGRQGYNGKPVGQWLNDDINGNSILQTSTVNQPVLKNNAADNINFNPVVAYSSANNLYNYVPGGFSGTATHSAVHVYAVTKFNNINSAQALLYERQASDSFKIRSNVNGSVTFTAGASGNAISTPTAAATPGSANEANKAILWTFSKDNTNHTGDGHTQDIRKNGIVVAFTNNTTTFKGRNANLHIGTADSSVASTFNGNIAEMIILYDSTVTAAKENKIESYLATKYGTTLGNTATPRSYTASNDSVYWPANIIYQNYQNDVFGIGTDSLTSLVQLKSNSVNSGSGDGTGQSAKGNLVLSTNTPLLDKHFLMIGNDAATLAQSVIAQGQAATIAVGSTRVGREWKVANTGAVGPVNISFDTTGLGPQAGGAVVSNYALMIDSDGDGNFTTGNSSFFTASSASGKKITFSGVTLTNGVVFTVITFKFSSALPAIWLGFTAEAVNGNALLNWKTSDEMNVDRYVVEHSYNGISFTVVGSVTANNNSGVNDYTYTDKGLSAGVHYYRIRRIDQDGKSEYSDIKSVKITTTGANVQVRPNPVVGSTLTLAVTVPQSSKTTIQVMSVDGKVMLQERINLAAGSNLVNLNVSTVPTGIYLVQVQLSDEVVTKKFIRQQH